jgi:CRISPR-associated protein Cas5d
MEPILDAEKVAVKVSGEFACFTRPDLKVERMSYPCMTPSAARGILDSILWKPEFKWYIRRIMLLKHVAYFSVKRNELKAKQETKPLSIEEVRTQRTSIILKNVAYIIEASVWQDFFDSVNPPVKYVEIFRRRVRKGQCFRRPYLGTREFACEFSAPTADDAPIGDTIPVGSLFYDMFYDAGGIPRPLFAYNTVIVNGVLDCENARNEQGTLNEMLMASSHIRPPRADGVKEQLRFYAQGEEEEESHVE